MNMSMKSQKYILSMSIRRAKSTSLSCIYDTAGHENILRSESHENHRLWNNSTNDNPLRKEKTDTKSKHPMVPKEKYNRSYLIITAIPKRSSPSWETQSKESNCRRSPPTRSPLHKSNTPLNSVQA